MSVTADAGTILRHSLMNFCEKKEPAQRIIVGYARVSSPKQKDES